VIADRKDVTELWTDPEHPRLEVADPVARAAVARELICRYPTRPICNCLVRTAKLPVQVPIDAVLIIVSA
jgi:hypothetical protein